MLLITSFTKFLEGAWLVVILVPTLVVLFLRIRTHYLAVGRAVALQPIPAQARAKLIAPPSSSLPSDRAHSAVRSGLNEREEAPDQVLNLTVVPVIAMDLASLRALAYAASLGQPVLAIHISTDSEEARRFRSYWQVWGDHVPLEIVFSPYRALVAHSRATCACCMTRRRTSRSRSCSPNSSPAAPGIACCTTASPRACAARAAPASGDRRHDCSLPSAELTRWAARSNPSPAS